MIQVYINIVRGYESAKDSNSDGDFQSHEDENYYQLANQIQVDSIRHDSIQQNKSNITNNSDEATLQ
jgi:hypothetical protein